MVYGLMKRHNGYIDVNSEAGRGTTFKLYFPLLQSDEVRAARVVPPVVAYGSETVLLVEDEDAIRRSVQRVLDRHGYRVLTVADGEQAMAFLGDHVNDVDLMIADAVMPKIGGMDLYERVRDLGGRVAFILTSGYSRQEALRGCDAHPGLAFLRKPWTVEELVHTIRNALDTKPSDVGAARSGGPHTGAPHPMRGGRPDPSLSAGDAPRRFVRDRPADQRG